MIKVTTAQTMRAKPEQYMDLAAKMVEEFTDTKEDYVLKEEEHTKLEFKQHKIYTLYHLMGGLNGEIWWKEQRIKELNEKIKEMGKELSALKRNK